MRKSTSTPSLAAICRKRHLDYAFPRFCFRLRLSNRLLFSPSGFDRNFNAQYTCCRIGMPRIIEKAFLRQLYNKIGASDRNRTCLRAGLVLQYGPQSQNIISVRYAFTIPRTGDATSGNHCVTMFVPIRLRISSRNSSRLRDSNP